MLFAVLPAASAEPRQASCIKFTHRVHPGKCKVRMRQAGRQAGRQQAGRQEAGRQAGTQTGVQRTQREDTKTK